MRQIVKKLQNIATKSKVPRRQRRVYPLRITVNGRQFMSVVIDPHYEKKHHASIDDEIILNLVKMLDGEFFGSGSADANGFKYFVNEKMKLKGKLYRLIWLFHEEESFIGVVNAHRR